MNHKQFFSRSHYWKSDEAISFINPAGQLKSLETIQGQSSLSMVRINVSLRNAKRIVFDSFVSNYFFNK